MVEELQKAIAAGGEPERELGSLPLERLEREIAKLAAHISAASCRWLLLVAELDRREGHLEWGCRSCAEWLSWRCGIAPVSAREQLRVARGLRELPRVRSAFARGELSYSKARALTRAATPESEAELLELARHATAAELDRILRAHRGATADLERANQAHAERSLSWSWADDGTLLVRAKLPAEDGALLLRALEATRERLRERAHGGGDASAEAPAGDEGAASKGRGAPAEAVARDPEPAAPAEGRGASAEAPDRDLARSDAEPGEPGLQPDDPEPRPDSAEPDIRRGQGGADALVAIAESSLAAGPAQRPGGERHQLVVHVDADALRDDHAPGRCELDDGPALHPETARRLACDAARVTVAEKAGRPLTVGRKTRTIPPALRRALRSRDGGCRFPGCTRRRHTDAHHLRHWARGGETRLSNLILLCRHHHRLLHEGGYTLERGPGQGLSFRRPDGRPIPTVPRPQPGDGRAPERQNHRLGLHIDPETPTALSPGQPYDLGMAVEGILAAEGLLDPGPGHRAATGASAEGRPAEAAPLAPP